MCKKNNNKKNMIAPKQRYSVFLLAVCTRIYLCEVYQALKEKKRRFCGQYMAAASFSEGTWVVISVNNND